jgi:glycine dehydrogenase
MLVAHDVLPQTLEVLQTRAAPLGITLQQVHPTQMPAVLAHNAACHSRQPRCGTWPR